MFVLSLSVGMSRDRGSSRIVLCPHLPPPTAPNLYTLGGFLEKNTVAFFVCFLKRFYLFILEREREGEREGEKHQCEVVSHVPLVGDLACNLRMSPVTLWFAGQHSIH